MLTIRPGAALTAILESEKTLGTRLGKIWAGTAPASGPTAEERRRVVAILVYIAGVDPLAFQCPFHRIRQLYSGLFLPM